MAIWGASHGSYYGFDSMAAVWACAAVLSVVLFPAVRCLRSGSMQAALHA
nr:hypothetical protein [Tanacetum cinerariifolium]